MSCRLQLLKFTHRMVGKYACVAHSEKETVRKEVTLVEAEPVSRYSSREFSSKKELDTIVSASKEKTHQHAYTPIR